MKGTNPSGNKPFLHRRQHGVEESSRVGGFHRVFGVFSPQKVSMVRKHKTSVSLSLEARKILLLLEKKWLRSRSGVIETLVRAAAQQAKKGARQ